jgi:3-oxoacyl-[acyl-carrier-protein] synthase-3
VVLEASDPPGLLASRLHADGRHADILCVPGSVDRGHVTGSPFLRMEGNAVFRFAVKVLGDVVDEVLPQAGLTRADIDWLIPHQANVRILEATAKRLDVPLERVVVTVDRHGNTSAASIPLALDVAVRDGRIRAGQHVVLEGVGGGFTWGAVVVRWMPTSHS